MITKEQIGTWRRDAENKEALPPDKVLFLLDTIESLMTQLEQLKIERDDMSAELAELWSRVDDWNDEDEDVPTPLQFSPGMIENRTLSDGSVSPCKLIEVQGETIPPRTLEDYEQPLRTKYTLKWEVLERPGYVLTEEVVAP
jgi:hypothetical protein